MWKKVIPDFVLAMVFTIILGRLQQATGLAPMASIHQLSPALGAIVTLLIFRKDGVKLNFGRPSFDCKSLLITVAIPFGIALVVFLLSKAFQLTAQAQNALTPLAIPESPLARFSEEIGWRQTRARKSPRMAFGVDRRPALVRTDFNILLAALFHTAINFSNLLYFNRLNDACRMAINALVWLLAAGFVILRNKTLFLPGQTP